MINYLSIIISGLDWYASAVKIAITVDSRPRGVSRLQSTSNQLPHHSVVEEMLSKFSRELNKG